MKTDITVTELWLMLAERDITFQYVDSGPEWAAGRDELDAIVSAAHQSPENRALYDCWMEMENAGIYGGPPLSYKNLDITRIGKLWVISDATHELGVTNTARLAVAFIDEHSPKPRQLPDNILPFTARFQHEK